MGSEDRQTVSLANPNLQEDRDDVYYHFGLSSKTHDLKAMFRDTKMVCMGGSSRRMKRLAEELAFELGFSLPTGQGLVNIIPDTDRYVMYKAGPIVCVNHGIGMPSISIVLHEIIKILNLAGCSNVTFFRIGTSGGLGLEPGTICISGRCYDTQFRPYLEQFILGQRVQREAVFDPELTQELLQIAQLYPNISAVSGDTLCTSDFYEEQGRTDGAICEHSPEQKLEFLHRAHGMGIRNIEMESLAFAAITHKLGIKAACMAVVLLDRFKHEQVTHDHHVIAQWELRMVKILSAFIMRRIRKENPDLRTAVCPSCNRRRGTSEHKP